MTKSFSCVTALAISLISLLCCHREIADSGQQGQGLALWIQEAGEKLQAGDCGEAKRYIEQHFVREPIWYDLMSRAHLLCSQKGQDKTEVTSAIRVLDDGLKAFPRSANLLLSKGYRYAEAGDAKSASASFAAARAKAEENLPTDSPGERAADTATADAAARALAQQNDPNVSDRQFEQAILQLVAAGNCADALGRVETERSHQNGDTVYHLLFISNQACYAKTNNASYLHAADDAVLVGVRKFPESSRLLVDAAARADQAGDAKEAVRLYKAALEAPDFDRFFGSVRATFEQRVAALSQQAK